MASKSDIITALCALLLLTGCSDPDALPGYDQIQLSAIMGDQTRTSMNGSTASFAAGDNIGVYETLTGRSNIQYTYGTPAWSTSTPIFWYNGTASHTFYAYYPYTTSNTGTRVGMPTLSTQAMTTSVGPAWDMLVAGPVTQTRAANIPLTFTHAFALIQINIRIGITIINPYILNRITFQGGNPAGSGPYGIANITSNSTQVGYDLVTKSVTAATNNAQSYTQTFYSDVAGTSLLNTAITFYAFLLPGTYTNPKPAVSFRISLLGIPSNTAFATFPTTTLQAGTKYVYNVSIGLLPTRSGEPQITLVPEEVVPF